MSQQAKLSKRIRFLLTFFMVALVVSGLTAIPLKWEMRLLQFIFTDQVSPLAGKLPALSHWVDMVASGLLESYGKYPFLAIGTDWLAFGHVVIGLNFIGAIKDPVRNIWVIHLGLIACALVVPWAFIFGALRGIPIFWQLIDCSFGVFGFIPLWLVRKYTLELEKQTA